eukprot:TRINITY_DN4799_c0_g1_i1.p1 TRINITY_DN4799_c0_g1~~TRINITY_DN4799_c0_g1_i1.p1  ORF type:complete len:125 (-),score=1.83 TRINITY_DN4799_c0_g1_i1:2236-2610(-)
MKAMLRHDQGSSVRNTLVGRSSRARSIRSVQNGQGTFQSKAALALVLAGPRPIEHGSADLFLAQNRERCEVQLPKQLVREAHRGTSRNGNAQATLQHQWVLRRLPFNRLLPDTRLPSLTRLRHR